MPEEPGYQTLLLCTVKPKTIIVVYFDYTVYRTKQRSAVELANVSDHAHGVGILTSMGFPHGLYNNNNNNRFMALCPSRYQKKHPQPTILIIIQSLSTSSIYHDP